MVNPVVSVTILLSFLFLWNVAVVHADEKPQPTEACPSTIVDQMSCATACSGGTVDDPGAYDFFILVDGSDGDYTYTGFNCECAEATPPVFCTYTYELPSCKDANVTSCDDGSCANLCDSLGFGIVGECSGSSELECECEFVTVVNNGTMQVNGGYVCEDEESPGAPTAAPSAAFGLELRLMVSLVTMAGIALLM